MDSALTYTDIKARRLISKAIANFFDDGKLFCRSHLLIISVNIVELIMSEEKHERISGDWWKLLNELSLVPDMKCLRYVARATANLAANGMACYLNHS
jgi:hypothetical protein